MVDHHNQANLSPLPCYKCHKEGPRKCPEHLGYAARIKQVADRGASSNVTVQSVHVIVFVDVYPLQYNCWGHVKLNDHNVMQI